MRNDGMAERATSHLHPRVGMTREATVISNKVPIAHAIYNSKMTDSTQPAKKTVQKYITGIYHDLSRFFQYTVDITHGIDFLYSTVCSSTM